MIKNNVAGYVRVSTEEQAKEGLSLQSQKNSIISFSNSQSWNLINIYEDSGLSGTTLERPALKALLDDIKNQSIDIILVYKIDRFSRKLRDLLCLIEDELQPNNVGFRSVTESIDTTSAQGNAFLSMMGAFNQLERDTIAERTKCTLADKISRGEHVGRVPFGFKIGSGGFLVPDKKEQFTISEAKRLRRLGKSLREISRRLKLTLGTTHKLVNTHLKSLNSKYINNFETAVVQKTVVKRTKDKTK